MKTLIVKNITLIFDTSEDDSDPIKLSLGLVDLINQTLLALNLPESPQILAVKGEVNCRVKDWPPETF